MSSRQRTVHVNGVDLFLTEDGDDGAFPVVLAHGFPELGYSWRHQLPALAAGGYHAVAPDQRGYGRSSRPAELTDYDIVHLTGDLLALLDDLGHEQAVFVGHDWGSMVVWNLALMAPERVAGVVGMSVPFLPRPPMPPIQMLRGIFNGQFFYMVYFQDPGVADAELGGDAERTARTMTRMLCSVRTPDGGADPADMAAFFADDGRGFVDRMPEPDGLPEWLTQDELDHYIAEFTRTGFTGGINWYRNMDRNWSLTEQLAGAKVEVPSLFVGGTNDPVLVMSPPSSMDGWLTDHRGTVLVEGAGHWVQQERPDAVNDALLTVLDSIPTRKGSSV
jgi:pimeloyl-ACP methyl ester carboxylesterase